MDLSIGWQPGLENPEPTNKKKERCLFVNSHFEDPTGEETDAQGLYWADDLCQRTRKRFANGVRFMCEKPVKHLTEGVGMMTFITHSTLHI